jgi:pimeloyl-ACP methyl ester carboxylesterase
MINVFRDQMPRPLIGIGHSMGGCQLTTLALIHPRLLSKLILIDPVINNYEEPSEPNVARASTFRVDLWPSKEDAEKAFRKSKFYQKWDSRVFDRWIRFGIREVPTAVYPAGSGMNGKAVTLSTTKHQEVFSFFRPNFQGRLENGEEVVNRETHPDMDFRIGVHYPFYRPEP